MNLCPTRSDRPTSLAPHRPSHSFSVELVTLRAGWSVLAAVHLTVPLWWSWLPIAVAWMPFLLAPLLAALATLSGPAKPPWRPWAIGAACGVGVTVALVAAFA